MQNYDSGMDPAGVGKWLNKTERIHKGDAEYVQVDFTSFIRIFENFVSDSELFLLFR